MPPNRPPIQIFCTYHLYDWYLFCRKRSRDSNCESLVRLTMTQPTVKGCLLRFILTWLNRRKFGINTTRIHVQVNMIKLWLKKSTMDESIFLWNTSTEHSQAVEPTIWILLSMYILEGGGNFPNYLIFFVILVCNYKIYSYRLWTVHSVGSVIFFNLCSSNNFYFSTFFCYSLPIFPPL